MGHPWPLFRYFSSFQTNITIQQQLYLSSIRGRDMNPQSSDCESHTITTRPRLASYQNIKFCCKYFAFPNLRTRQAIVTRFGKIPPLWPIFKSLGQFLGLVSIRNLLNLIWPTLVAIMAIFSFLQMAKYSKEYLAIWSH